MKKQNSTRRKGISYIFLELFLLILVSSIIFIVIYSAMQEGNNKRRIIVPEALDAPYQPYRPIKSVDNTDGVTPMDSMMRDVYVVQREINQGSHQLYLFFDTFTHQPAPLDLKHFDLKNPKDAQWYNFGIYFIMFLLVVFPTLSAFLAKFIFNLRVKDKREWFNNKVRDNMGRIDKAIGFIINHKIMIVFIVFLIAILLSMVNLSIPLEKEYEYRADPFFVFVCFSSLAVATVALKYVLKGLKKIKVGGETSLSSKSIFRTTLFWGALGIWAMGFLCYFIGMYSLGTQKSVLASIVRPALESGKMFVLSDSTKEISFTLRNNGAFMGFYTICKLGFLLISSFALVSVAWSRIVSYSTIRKRSVDPGDMYVFFGINENSKILAQDVAKRLREEKKKRDAEKNKLADKKRELKSSNATLEKLKKELSTAKNKSKKKRLAEDIRKQEIYNNNLKDNIKNKEIEIEKEDAKSGQHWTIAMVENRNNPSEGEGNGMTISNLIGMFNFRKDAYAETREIDNKALLVVSDSSIGSRECSEQIEDVRKMIDNDEEPDKETKYGLFNSLGLKNLSKMIKNANKGINELIQEVKKKTEKGEELDDKTKKKLFKHLAHHLDSRDLSTLINMVKNSKDDNLIRKAEKRIKKGKELKNKMKKELLTHLCDSLGFGKFINEVQKAKNYNHKCHFFFLDEDARANIDAADNLREMLEIVHPNHPKTTIYCLARDNAFSSLLEREDNVDNGGNAHKNEDNGDNARKIEIKLLDLSVMAAQTLFLDPDNHPINFVDCDTDTATVKSRFDALILGFGRSGRDIVRYLYEFGAFLDYNKINDGKVIRSPFQCTIMDKDIDLIKPRYLAKIPAVKAVSYSDNENNQQSTKTSDAGNNMLLRFVKAALNSNEFVSLIDEKLNKKETFANFVVINLGSDSANMGALTYLVDQVMRNCEGNLGKLRIFVRSYDPSFEDMVRDRANHYKELLGGKSVVRIFGQRSQLLTYDMVVDGQISSRADKFHDIYSKNLQSKHQSPSDNHEGTDDNCARWRQQNCDLRQKTQDIHNGIHIDTKLRLVGLERHINYKELLMDQMGQDQIKNHIDGLVREILHLQEPMPKLYKHPHKWIKTHLLGKKDHEKMVNQIQRIIVEKRQEMVDMLPFPDKDLKQKVKQFKDSIEFTDEGRSFHLLNHLLPFYLHFMPGDKDKDYKKLDLIYKNLAINEHLRWVASLEMLGYTGPNNEQKATMTKCDDVAMVHHGMVDWNDPYNKEEYKAFDHLLVKSSFELAYKILQDHEESFEQARSEALKKALIKELEKNIDPKIDQIQKEELIKNIEQVLDEEPKQGDKEESSEVAEEFGADE